MKRSFTFKIIGLNLFNIAYLPDDNTNKAESKFLIKMYFTIKRKDIVC